MLYVLSLLVLWISVANAQPAPDTLWTRTFGTCYEEGCWSLSATADGGYLLTGFTAVNGTDNHDFLVVATDADGQLRWQRTYGGNHWDEAIATFQTFGGGYQIVGHMDFGDAPNPDHPNSNVDLVILLTDSLGQVTDSHRYGWPAMDLAHGAKQLPDGGLIIVGETRRVSPEGDFLVMRTDSAGNLLWMRTFGGGAWDRAFGAQVTRDGGFIVCGESRSFNCTYAIRLTAEGDSLWSACYGMGTYATVDTLGSGYVFAGLAAPDEFYIVRTKESGNTLWTRSVGGVGYEAPWNLCRVGDGVVVVGATSSFGQGSLDAYVVRVSGAGEVLWSQPYGGQRHEIARGCAVNPAGQLVIAGVTASYGAGSVDMYLFSLDDVSGTGAPPPATAVAFALAPNYPNPFNASTTIPFRLAQPGHVSLDVYNTQGQKVQTLVDRVLTGGEHRATFVATDLPSGVYFAHLQTAGREQTLKMLYIR